MKLFSPDPRLGFLAAAGGLRSKIAAGGAAAELAEWRHLLFNNMVNVFVTATFMVLVLCIVVACARQWWLLLTRAKRPDLRESEYVALPA